MGGNKGARWPGNWWFFMRGDGYVAFYDTILSTFVVV